jgi:hypothetical protein
MTPGGVYHDKGFVSTSMEPTHAKNFTTSNHTTQKTANGEKLYQSHLAHIIVPRGANALHVPVGRNHEHEVVLPRGSSFTYHGSELHDYHNYPEKPDTTHPNGYVTKHPASHFMTYMHHFTMNAP